MVKFWTFLLEKQKGYHKGKIISCYNTIQYMFTKAAFIWSEIRKPNFSIIFLF